MKMRWGGSSSAGVGGLVSELHFLTLSNHRPCYKQTSCMVIFLSTALRKTLNKRKCLDLELFLLRTSSKITIPPLLFILFHNLKFDWWTYKQIVEFCSFLTILHNTYLLQLQSSLGRAVQSFQCQILVFSAANKMDKMLMWVINKLEWRLGKLRDNVQSQFKSREQHLSGG